MQRYGRDQIDQLVSFLDRAGDDCRVWQGVRFMERHGIDLSLRYLELSAYIRAALRAVTGTEDVTADDERQSLLELRARAREDEGLPPLAVEEQEQWRFEPVQVKATPSDDLRGDGHQLTIEEAVEAIARRSPGLARALVLVGAHNAAAEGDWEREVSTRWLFYEIENLIPDLLEPLPVGKRIFLTSDVVWSFARPSEA